LTIVRYFLTITELRPLLKRNEAIRPPCIRRRYLTLWRIPTTEEIIFIANRIFLAQSWPLKSIEIRFNWVMSFLSLILTLAEFVIYDQLRHTKGASRSPTNLYFQHKENTFCCKSQNRRFQLASQTGLNTVFVQVSKLAVGIISQNFVSSRNLTNCRAGKWASASMSLANVEVLHFGSLPSRDKSHRKSHSITSLAHLRPEPVATSSRKAGDSLRLAKLPLGYVSRRVRIQSQPFKHEQARTHFSLPVRYGDTKPDRAATVCGFLLSGLLECPLIIPVPL
jgi:hypothetical protein